MVFNLGGFKFNQKQNLTATFSKDYAVSQQTRLSNAPALFCSSRPSTEITLNGETLPFVDGTQALSKLYDIADKQKSITLTNGEGIVFGRFVVVSITEEQSVWVANGRFLKQSFSVVLRRDNDTSDSK